MGVEEAVVGQFGQFQDRRFVQSDLNRININPEPCTD
jgi:hypothetical protein